MSTTSHAFDRRSGLSLVLCVGISASACGTSGTSPGAGGVGNAAGATAVAATGGAAAGTGDAGRPAASAGTAGVMTSGSGGSAAGAGKAGAGSAGAAAGGGGANGGTSALSGAGGVTAGSAGSSGASSGSLCTTSAWPTADPAVRGAFETVTETNVGPAAGMGADGGAPVAFTLFRPKDLGQGGLCHPVITWGNGTGSSPGLYKVLLDHLASHGFVVIASDSPNVADGDPQPMVAGVTWVLEQNDDPTSVLYGRIDATHVGATGHSQGGFATTTAGGDSQVTTIAPLCGASNQRNLHGPAWLFCGGGDTTVPCSTVQRAYDSIENQPVMLADYLAADHVNWVTFRGTTPGPVEVATTAWMRVHLMGDSALRAWFYGPDCKLCTDTAWQVSQKMMDE